MPQYITVFGGILQFQGISVNDQGKYVCSATNAVGRAEAVAEVIVQGKKIKPFFLIKYKESVKKYLKQQW